MSVSFKTFFYELMEISSPVKRKKLKREVSCQAQKNRVDNITVVEELLSLPDILGPFDALDEQLKQQFRAFSAHYFAEKSFKSSRIVRFIARGALYKLCVQFIKAGWNVRKKTLLLSRILIFLGRKGIKGLEWMASKYLMLSFKADFYEAPILNVLYRHCQLDPKELIDEYVKQIPASSSSSPVFRIEGSNSRACALIGLDFLPSKGQLYFIESNVTPGHYMDRHLCSSAGDTVCRHLLDYAKKQDLKEIVFYPTGFQKHFDARLEAAWHDMAEKNGVNIEIVDDAFLGSPLNRMISSDLDYTQEQTLYVIGRKFVNPLANLVGRKGLMEKNISLYNEQLDPKDRILLPEVIDQDILPEFAFNKDSRFPNIIVKNKYIDQAKGIHLFKSDSIPSLARNPDYIASTYTVPDTIKKEEGDQVNEFVYLFRTYLLITPDGPVYAGTRKDLSGTPLPASLDEGEVADIAPYITNITTAGDYCVAHTPEEHALCKEATLKVGVMLHSFMKEKYDLTI